MKKNNKRLNKYFCLECGKRLFPRLNDGFVWCGECLKEEQNKLKGKSQFKTSMKTPPPETPEEGK